MNGFAGLAPISLILISFFFWGKNPWVSVFNRLGFFFLVGLPITNFNFNFFFQILVQKFFDLFIYLFENVPNFF